MSASSNGDVAFCLPLLSLSSTMGVGVSLLDCFLLSMYCMAGVGDGEWVGVGIGVGV